MNIGLTKLVASHKSLFEVSSNLFTRVARTTFKMGHLEASHIYPAVDPQFMYFPSRRSTVHSTKGIVASTQPLATECGLRILKQGGNCAVYFDLSAVH